MKNLLKIFALLIAVVVLCSCNQKSIDTTSTPQEIIVFPTGEMADTVNGYRIESNTNIEDNNEDKYLGNYVANNSTKKFHKASCHYAINLDKSKITVTDNRQELVNKGYSPCKKCNP